MLRTLFAGAVAGALDIVYAWITWTLVLQRLTTVQVAQSVATGLLGRGAYKGGLATAMLGLTLHFAIAIAWSVGYYVATRRLAWLRRLIARPTGITIAGLAYGAVICLAMSRIVVPLSRARTAPMLTWVFLAGLLAHMVLIGLPIALIIGRPTAAAPLSSRAERGI